MPATEKHRSAIELYKAGQLEEADQLITDALHAGETGELWNDWAVIQFALGRHEEAKTGFRRAIAFDPACCEAETNLTAMMFCTEESRSASESEEALLVAYRKYGSALNELKQMAHGLVGRFPQSEETRFFLADVLDATGQADQALAEYETLQKIVSGNQKRRVEQAIRKCLADRDYFPPEFANRLESNEYSVSRNANSGHNSVSDRIANDRELMVQSWRSYAHREIQRGREIVRIVRERIPLAGRRVLDVGCGYGGSLICFAEQGADAIGVEVDEDRFQIGKKRLTDLGINADYRLEDICASDAPRRLGTFDVIVVQDVMEHVMDPVQAIRTLSLILRRGGVIYVQVGNKYSFDQLHADHHYRLAGITVLARDQAIDYFHDSTGIDRQAYGVGYWRTERFYRRIFAKFGVQLDHLGPPASLNHVLWYANMAGETCQRANGEIYPGLRLELKRRIRRRVAAVGRYFCQISDQIIKSESDPQLVASLCDTVVKRVCEPVWRFIGVKPIRESAMPGRAVPLAKPDVE
jgi:2-polyprenyl-3-methyl-5-hydroxy-6-metoxy-1,4-benzoquinol methylase